MGDSEWLDTWAAEFELCPDTLTCLAQKGFSSKGTFKKLTSELIRAEFKKLPLGQLMMLEEACESLRDSTSALQGHAAPENTPAGDNTGEEGGSLTSGSDRGRSRIVGQGGPSASVDTHDATANAQGLTAQDIANFIEQGNSVLSGNVQHGKPFIFDPLQFGVKCKKASFKDIRDFISLVPKNSETTSEAECIQIGSREFMLKDSKIPLELIDVSQYMEGSLRILRDFALQDNYCKEQMIEYINYVIKVATLAQCFEWKSVLKYDQAYRRAQAETGFTWGADNSYFMQLYLKPESCKTLPPAPYTQRQNRRPNGTGPPPLRQSRTKNKYDPGSGKPICIKWNGANGCNFPDCKYAHICMECYTTAHTQVVHRSRPAADSGNV